MITNVELYSHCKHDMGKQPQFLDQSRSEIYFNTPSFGVVNTIRKQFDEYFSLFIEQLLRNIL